MNNQRRTGLTTEMWLAALHKQIETGVPSIIVMNSQAECDWLYAEMLKQVRLLCLKSARDKDFALAARRFRGQPADHTFIDHHVYG